MTHGDLKGVSFNGFDHLRISPSPCIKANILIDHAGHPRLADFGLLTIISDPSNLLPSSSYTQGGTARWMSPELIDPQRVGVDSNRPTKSSDCYALGMVIYETITGHLPFHKYPDPTVFVKVLEGKRPSREKGFVDGLWEILEKCWKPQPNARPSVEDVLRCLEQVSGPVNRDANRHTNIPLGMPPYLVPSVSVYSAHLRHFHSHRATSDAPWISAPSGQGRLNGTSALWASLVRWLGFHVWGSLSKHKRTVSNPLGGGHCFRHSITNGGSTRAFQLLSITTEQQFPAVWVPRAPADVALPQPATFRTLFIHPLS